VSWSAQSEGELNVSWSAQSEGELNVSLSAQSEGESSVSWFERVLANRCSLTCRTAP